MGKVLRLEGPPADSLLGFLSTIGLVMALEKTTKWSPKLAWKDRTAHLCINSDSDVTDDDVVKAAVAGISKFSEIMKFPVSNLKIELDKQRELQNGLDPSIAVAFGSDACKRKNEDVAEPTPLCMMFGSGHQDFLPRLTAATTISKQELARATAQVHEALFSKWKYKDTEPKIAFRWDPTEYRPHALRATDPTKEKANTMNGANRLAAVGFTSCMCVPTRKGLSTALCGKDGGIVWPIWSSPLSMASIRIMMTYPVLKKMLKKDVDQDTLTKLDTCGINSVMKARLFWDGKYKNVTAAIPIAVSQDRD